MRETRTNPVLSNHRESNQIQWNWVRLTTHCYTGVLTVAPLCQHAVACTTPRNPGRKGPRTTNSSADNATINLEDYRLVRILLRSPVVCSPDDLCDPLTIDMINRANIFLKVKYGPDSVVHNPFAAVDYDKFVHGRGGPPRCELVTRKEIADLGNTGSETVKQLLEYLRYQTDGHSVSAKTGLRRRLQNRDEWQAASIDSLTACLRPWTYKQVRIRLERLS